MEQNKIPENATAQQVYEFLEMCVDKLDFRSPLDIARYDKLLGTYFSKLNAPYHLIDEDFKILTRVRKHSTARTPFPNITDLLCPPKEIVGVNRANVPLQPIYYCSNDPGTSIYEVRPEVGDWITTLDLEFPVPTIDLLILGLDKNKKISGVFTEIDKGIHLFLEKHFTKEVNHDKSHLYYHTAIFVKRFIGSKDGVAYPSVGSGLKGWNFALKTDFVDEHKKFIRATVHEVVAVQSKYEMIIKCLYRAGKPDSYGDFKWKRDSDCDGHLINPGIYD